MTTTAESPAVRVAGVEELRAEVAELRAMLAQILGLLANPPAPARTHYSVEEFAALPGINVVPFTIRRWCRDGRINATKLAQRRGGFELWSIPAEEVERYRNHGLLAPRPR